MDDLIEIILEIIIKVAVKGSNSKRVPKPIRYILFAIIMALCLSVMAFFIYLMVTMDSSLIVKLIFLGVAVTIDIFLFRLIKEIIVRN